MNYLGSETSFTGYLMGNVNVDEFLKVSIKVFSPLLFSNKQGMCHCEEPVVFVDVTQTVIHLWLSNEHYEPIIKI